MVVSVNINFKKRTNREEREVHRKSIMAAAIIAIRNQEAENEAIEHIEEKKISLENMRSKIPAKENRAAEFYLSVLVLG